jgi:hypothetical protein
MGKQRKKKVGRLIGGLLKVLGVATLDSDLSVGGNASVTGTLDVTGAVSMASTLSVTGATDVAELTRQYTEADADGAIAVQSGTVYITKATAAALTLADPTVNGRRLLIISTTAAAHTVDNSAGSGFNGGGAGSDVGTFGGAAYDRFELESIEGVWVVLNNTNVTLA